MCSMCLVVSSLSNDQYPCPELGIGQTSNCLPLEVSVAADYHLRQQEKKHSRKIPES